MCKTLVMISNTTLHRFSPGLSAGSWFHKTLIWTERGADGLGRKLWQNIFKTYLKKNVKM